MGAGVISSTGHSCGRLEHGHIGPTLHIAHPPPSSFRHSSHPSSVLDSRTLSTNSYRLTHPSISRLLIPTVNMGFFSLKKKSAAPSTVSQLSPPSSSRSASPVAPSPSARPTLQLRVAIHAALLERANSDELFYIEVDPEEGVEAIRRVISRRIGGVALSMFKVSLRSCFSRHSAYAC